MISPTDKAIKIFQYWNSEEVPQEVQRTMHTWKKLGGLQYRLFNRKKARVFIKNNYDERTLKAFLQCKVPAMQADFFRYCALYKHGGLYIDADIALRENTYQALVDLLSSAENALIMTRERAIANDFIFIREPKSPLIKKVIDKAISNIEKRTSNNVWEVTGPGIMTTLFKDQSADSKALFEASTIKSFKTIRSIVDFKWKLDYKKGKGHWTNVQKSQSIFRELKSKKENKPKVFCVGFNKTGTSSLHAYFQHHGMRSMHNLIWQEATHYLGPKRLATFLKQYDAYSDGEMANIERIYELYPEAYYILNVRELDSWVKSRIKWLHRQYPKKVRGPMGQDFYALGDKVIPTWVDRRNAYHHHVINYFKENGGRLLVVNVCSDKDWVKKCDAFIGITTEVGTEFHSNKQVYTEMSEEKKIFIDKEFEDAVDKIIAIVKDAKELTAERIISTLPIHQSPYDNRLNLRHLVRKRFK